MFGLLDSAPYNKGLVISKFVVYQGSVYTLTLAWLKSIICYTKDLL